MRTTDLIPLILLELKESDKYGFELVKAIETKSNSKIIIKQPTLYTILKKLEKSKFISSYWQDSDIGGKRHYYKLSPNGMAQVSTLPSYSALLSTAIANDIADGGNQEESTSQETVAETTQNDVENNKITSKKDNYVSIMDLLTPEEPKEEAAEQITLKETVLPTEEVFATNSIDTLTETEQNLKNTEMLKTDTVNKNEQFASSESVKTFTEKKSSELSDEYKDKLKTIYANNTSSTALNPKPVNAEIDNIRFVEYENIKTNPNYVQSRAITKSMLYKILCSSAYLVAALVLCAIVTSFTKTSALYYTFLILGICTLIFYPTLFAFKLDKFKENCQNNNYKSKLKLRSIFAACFMVCVLLVCIIVNIALKKGSFGRMFADFANFYAPLIISSVVCFDVLFTYIFITKKYKV